MPLWWLTLPAIKQGGDSAPSWLNPFGWEGANGWTPWGNCLSMIVAAEAEEQARQLAALEDCDIWLDTRYVQCVSGDQSESGVILTERGGAENE